MLEEVGLTPMSTGSRQALWCWYFSAVDTGQHDATCVRVGYRQTRGGLQRDRFVGADGVSLGTHSQPEATNYEEEIGANDDDVRERQFGMSCLHDRRRRTPWH